MDERELQQIFEQIDAQFDRVRKPVTDAILKEEVFIPVTEEYRLRTVILKPADVDGPYSTIVIRNCYPFSEPVCMHQAQEFARRGFAAVVQWTRGLHGSEGEWEPYIYERNDGKKLMDYLQEQAWVKNIGLMGASYLALVGWSIADILPEKVKTMYLTVLGTEWHVSVWQEGAFRQDVYTAWLMSNARDDVKADYLASAKYRPQIQVDEDLWEARVQVYRDFISHPAPADEYWTKGMWKTLQDVPGRMKIPVFMGEGWYDIHLGNMLRTYEKLSDAARAHTVFQINPGNHPLVPVIPGQKKQDHASIAEYEQQIRWFTDILMENRLPEPSLNYYLIGADEWRQYSTYPIPNTENEEWYLDGHALTQAPGVQCERSYTYDPDHPVPAHGSGTLFYTHQGVGSLLQPEADYRPDVLSYLSEPLENERDIIGKIQVKLWVESDAPDTCFTAKLMEVTEAGEAYNIRDGITTIAFTNGAQTAREYHGGQVEVTIDCWDIAYRVQKGSRLRLDISSSNFPEYNAHPNTVEIWAFAKEAHIAHQKVLTGMQYPSRLILPLEVRSCEI